MTTGEAPPPCGPTRSVEGNRDQNLYDTSPSPLVMGKTDDTTVVNDNIAGEQHFYFISLLCKCKSVSIVAKGQAVNNGASVIK